MSILEIYSLIAENKEDSFYVELSAEEIMLVPVFIEILSDGSFNQRAKSASVLEKISKEHPSRLTPFVPYIIKALDKHKDFPAWCIWKILANLVDKVEHNSELNERFITTLYSDNISEFSIVCDCAVIFAKTDDELEKQISFVLSKTEGRDFALAGTPNEACRKIALSKAKAYFSAMEKAKE